MKQITIEISACCQCPHIQHAAIALPFGMSDMKVGYCYKRIGDVPIIPDATFAREFANSVVDYPGSQIPDWCPLP